MKRKKEKTSLPVHCMSFLLHRYLPSPSTLLVGYATGTAHRLFHCFRLLSLSNGKSQREESFHVEKRKIFRFWECACFAAFKSVRFQFDMAVDMQKHFLSALSASFLECFHTSFLSTSRFAVIRNENSVNFCVPLIIFLQRGFLHFILLSSLLSF